MYSVLLILCFQMMVINSAPLPMQFLAPYDMLQRPQAIQSPLPLLQEQLMELQAMQQVQPISPVPMNQMQPLIILLPGFQNDLNSNSNAHQILNKRISEANKGDSPIDDEDSVVIEAEPMKPIPTIDETQKAILLLPNARFSINGIITSIPWLPFEINVPDTIAWMYNGILSIFGRFPSQNSPENRLKFKQNMNIDFSDLTRPIIVIPI